MNSLITRLMEHLLTSTIFIHIMSGSLHWSSYTVCLSLLMYFKCNPPQQLKFLKSSILQQFNFNNSLLQLLQEEKPTNSMYCISFNFMFHSSALSKQTLLNKLLNPNFRLTMNVLNKNCPWTTRLQNVPLIILKLQPMGSQAVLKLSFVTSLEGKPPLLEQVLGTVKL